MDQSALASPRGFKHSVASTILAGAAVAVPFIITGWALWWFGRTIETAVRDSLIGRYLPERPGVGFVTGLVVVLAACYLLGLLTRLYLVRKVVQFGEWVMLRIPLAKSLYEASRDLMRFFGGSRTGRVGRVVQVSLAGGQVRMIGLLTNEVPRGAGQPAQGEPGRVAVFLPLSYTWGGFTVYVTPDQVRPLDLSVEQAMKIAATADVA